MTAEPPLRDPRLRPGSVLLAEGRAEVATWRLGRCAFLDAHGVPSEAAFKRARAAEGRIMRHAHVGFREVGRSLSALAEIHARCAPDRFGICLDWSMGYPAALRAGKPRGTGIVLRGVEDFARITAAAPVAPHFGDFMLGLPAALENTRAALAAGVTSIGNLGQYFTFRLPGWDDDVATTEATVAALGLIAAQPAEVLVHSNLDDGFAALFGDLASSLGMVLFEKHVVEGLIGARVAHCWGHHFTDPRERLAFHLALAEVSDTPGSMVYGNTVAYRSTPAGNHASLASYLLADLVGQMERPTGHAVNPVPVTENERIPDVEEIVDAQMHAIRLAEHAAAWREVVDFGPAREDAARIVAGGRRVLAALLDGLAARGVDPADPAAMLLAVRRLGAKRIERLFGAGEPDPRAPNGRRPVALAAALGELEEMAEHAAAAVAPALRATIAAARPRVIVATTDVHEHGKYLLEGLIARLGAEALDGGVAADPDDLAEAARQGRAQAVCVSTYNGIALDYARRLLPELASRGLDLPVLMGGRLNQVPEGSNTGLPQDVTAELRALGVRPCADLDGLVATLGRLATRVTEEGGHA